MEKLLKANPHHTDFGKEIIPTAIKTLTVKAWLFDGYWEDIGTIEAFYNANLALLDYPKPAFDFYDASSLIYTRQRFLPPTILNDTKVVDAMLSEGCNICAKEIIHSIIGVRSKIASGSVIRDSLIMGADFFESRKSKKTPVGIGKNCVIQKAIIDKNARIGDNVKLVNEKNLEDVDNVFPGVYIKSGIFVVTKNCEIPAGTVL